MKTPAYFIQNFGPVTSECWHPCAPVPVWTPGPNCYLHQGTVAFVFLDGRSVAVQVLTGLPGATPDEVLRATIASLRDREHPTSLEHAKQLFDVMGAP